MYLYPVLMSGGHAHFELENGRVIWERSNAVGKLADNQLKRERPLLPLDREGCCGQQSTDAFLIKCLSVNAHGLHTECSPSRGDMDWRRGSEGLRYLSDRAVT